MKIGQLTDKQLEDGLTEKKAVDIIQKAKKPADTMKLRNGDLKTSNVTLCG